MATRFDDWEGDYLAHYSVLGMKWGQRRYQNPDGSLTAAGKKHYQETGEYGYHYKSHATKKYERKEVKALAKAGRAGQYRKNVEKQNKWLKKADIYANRAKRSAEIDRGEQEYAQGLKTSHAILLSMLGSANSMKGYAQYRAMAGESGKALTGKKIVSAILAYNFGSYGSRQRKAAYIRQDEGKKGLGQKAFRMNTKIQNLAAQSTDSAINRVRGLGAVAKAGAKDAINGAKSMYTGKPYKSSVPVVASEAEERRAARKERKQRRG